MKETAPTSHQVTELLDAWGKGDEVARDELMSLVYDELHRLAHHYMKRESPRHTLQTSALVNEAFVRKGEPCRRLDSTSTKFISPASEYLIESRLGCR